ncbi:hypothetical protein [Pseudomonas sp. PDM25]|uniref:hypothetical protein n=1 Tax=Pseudomonas sp. PDM25 TaxID=2854772 RepID=UPI0028120EEB|nr:hypothetical protein [Pseudomonas sp. PDM25]
MNTKLLGASLFGCLLASTASAGTNEWTADWAQGVSKYLVDDGNDNELNISCSNENDSHNVTAFCQHRGKAMCLRR